MAQREKRDARGNGSSPGKPGRRDREDGHARAKQLAPIGRPQRAESERERERTEEKAAADRRGPPVRRHGRAGARPNWAELGYWAAFPFSFSLDFLIPFLFLFYRVFFQIQIRFQIQINSNLCKNSKNI